MVRPIRLVVAIFLSVAFCWQVARGAVTAENAKATLDSKVKLYDSFIKVFKFTADQQARWDAAKNSLAEKVKADPKLTDDDHAFELQIRKEFRDVLTPQEQGSLDEVMIGNDSKEVLKKAEAKLKKVEGGLEVYANYHDGKWAPDLASTIGGGQDQAEDLVVWSLPATISFKGAPDQAKWVKDHCDLVYLPLGGKLKDKPADKVIVYIKPELLWGNAFLMGDGKVVTVADKNDAAKIVKQLQNGQNPPPDLSRK
ncbi:MAG TPA: hypothetical protein VFE47_01040 [Tepidisphaeraceae bacterium]|jgi:hypothetical protein|nr:hypothetical protein [Tepidisphaeraceae bacterium]